MKAKSFILALVLFVFFLGLVAESDILSAFNAIVLSLTIIALLMNMPE